MKILPLTESLAENYIKIGTEAYNQHYLHLWENRDSSPYIQSSFTLEVLQNEIANENSELSIIIDGTDTVGILKILKNQTIKPYSAKDALLLEKIYILKKHTGKGIGKKVLDFTVKRAKELHKKIIWLDTMQNGPALQFYLSQGFKIHDENLLHFPKLIDSERPMYLLIKIL